MNSEVVSALLPSDFTEEDKPVLALLSFSAEAAAYSPLTDTIISEISSKKGEKNAMTFSEKYVEVRMIELITSIRSGLRTLQRCPKHARVSFLRQIASHFDALFECLPDPLFLSVGDTLRKMTEKGEWVRREHSSLLEVHLLFLIEEVQREVLSSTRRLTKRSGCLTLRFSSSIPFVMENTSR